MQTFSSDYFILNYVQSLRVIVSKNEEEFDFSISNDVFGVQIRNSMDILEIIPHCRSDPFALIDLELPTNSYRIACTNTQNFEEGENCASPISMKHLDFFHTLGYDIILFGSIFKFQELPVMLVVVLINFFVKNQVPQVSFKIIVGDLMLVFSSEFDDIICCG